MAIAAVVQPSSVVGTGCAVTHSVLPLLSEGSSAVLGANV